MHISGLFIYPVKSLRGCAVPAAELDALGLVGDRRFMIVDETGRFRSQRSTPQLARISVELSGMTLKLGHGQDTTEVNPPATERPLRTVSIWSSSGLKADDCGDDVAQWLSRVTGVSCRLVAIGTQLSRPIAQGSNVRVEDRVSFADAYPLLAISESALADLNDRLIEKQADPVGMERFRPNVVIADAAPFAEDTWTRVKAGSVVLRAAGPCARCTVVTTDQATGDRGPEPLRTLATYRQTLPATSDVNFGQNLINESKSGWLRVGDRIDVLE